MALSPGERLGPYEVLARLGAGGMGEVYKARDTRLGRTVAIKVLPADVSADASARARFEREARAIAALQHPHICVVHDVGRERDTDYLVMELLEGETLSERLARAEGPLPIDEVLTIGAAIADALDKAHRAGIVHRDLKPLNVMLTKSGPKLLDFGLAKLHATSSPVSLSGASAATTAGPGTAKGTILGTIHYMAPEQVEGREADARVDIWALGTLLYEMATGRRPFEGESAASVIGAILKDTPEPLSARQPLSPRLLERIVSRCLAKDPDARWQSAGDVSAELAWLQQERTGVPSSGTVPLPARRQSRVGWMVAAVLLLVAAVLAVPATRALRETSRPLPPETRLEIVTPATDDPLSFALSPDGRQIVFAASGEDGSRLWLRSLSTTMAQPLPGTEGGAFPFWSPDGRSIAFTAGNALKRLDVGGSVRTLAAVTGIVGGSWSSTGVIVISYSAGGNALMQLPEDGGAVTPVTTLRPRQSSHRWPWFLRDGRHFLFYAQGSRDVLGVYLGSLDGGEPTRLIETDSSPVFLAPDWILWNRGPSLMAQRLDVERGALVGEPVPVDNDLANDNRFARAAVSASATGMIAYRTGSASRRQLTWFDRSGAAVGTAGEADTSGLETPRLSADGGQLAVGRSAQNNQDIWLLDGARARRLTFEAGIDRFPVWSPDGRRMAFMSNRGGPLNLYTKLTNGAGDDELLVDSGQVKVPTSWSADGRYLLFHSLDPKTSADLWVMPMTGDRTPSVLLRTPFREAWGAFSPDGRWVAYQSNEAGQPEIYVRAFTPPGGAAGDASGAKAAGGGQWQVSTAGGVFPVWSPDGRELFFLDLSAAIMSASIDTAGGALNAGAPTRLFSTRIAGGAVGNQVDRQFDVGRDGRFLLNVELEVAAPPITVIQNWNPEPSK